MAELYQDVFTNEEVDELVRRIVPTIMSQLLLEGKVSESSSSEELLFQLRDFLDRGGLDDAQWTIIVGEEFEDALRAAIENEQCLVAYTLAGTYTEQLANEFYYLVLIDHFGFSSQEYRECMKKLSLNDKLTWFYRMTTSNKISSDLVSKIDKLHKARNHAVHYKPTPVSFEGKGIGKSQPALPLSEITPLIEALKQALQAEIEKIFPERKLGQALFDVLSNS